MDKDEIISRMNKYLHKSAEILADWLGKLLPKTSANWWEDCVISNLSYRQQEIAKENKYTNLAQFDLAALLRIANKSWYLMKTGEYLPPKYRECIRDMMRVRNNWAHVSATMPGKDRIVEDLTTIYQFFEQRGYDNGLLVEIGHMIDEVKSPATEDFTSIEKEKKSTEKTETGNDKEENEIQVMSQVYLVGEPDTRGIVTKISDLGNTIRYDVFVNGKYESYYSDQIKPVIEKSSYNWVDIDTFQSYLTAYQINNPSGNNLYSLNSARIDFVPYQFRPALKLIHADEPRILIADSVGVGKTIEAGLIIKELQARQELENVMIICPKPLVSERKWELEMKRFDEDFIPVDGPSFRQIISDTDRDGEWPVRYSKIIVPYSILDGNVYEGKTTGRKRIFGLRDLDPAPHFDLVIIDEAHHIRNGSMEKEKAYAYKCVKYFCDNADAVVMLTATPLQTSDDELYTLLNVLRPDIVIDKQTFSMMSKPNAYISAADSVIRKAGENWQTEALQNLKEVLGTQWGENVIAKNPAYRSVLKTLQQDKISREERVKLISDVESLHSFNSMINRTRRKDIQDFCVRRPYTLAVNFTDKQKELHDELLVFEQNALTQIHGNARNISFMMSTIKRQAASCIFGLAPHIRDIINKRFQQLNDDPDFDPDEFMLKGEDTERLAKLAENLLYLADRLPEEDPKFDRMMAVIRKKQEQENNKIIIFSSFRYTLAYLRKKLAAEGLRIAQIDGSVKDAERQDLRSRFELPRNDENAIDILLFTEVGSEGLDYQFCNMMINYDLPWNPMRIEQRIGRIDRRGQQSATVSIYNMVTDDTVDADIYYRCLSRIGVFYKSIGECDKILGDIATQIDQLATDPTLTEEERRQKLEQMADNEVRQMQEMNRLEEEEKELFGFDLSEYMTKQEIRDAENPWLNPKNLMIMITQYLTATLGEGNYILGDNDLKQLRLSADNRVKLREDYIKLPHVHNAVRQRWEIYLKGNKPLQPITFDPETAEKNRDSFFITAMHPLTKQAAAYFKSNEQTYIHLQYVSEDFAKGKYYFSVYAWNYVGISNHFRLIVVCDNDTIATELPDILQVAQSITPSEKVQSAEWSDLEKKQVELWRAERSKEINESKNTANFKIESLTNNFRNRKRSLEQRIMDTDKENIRRMFRSELVTAEENYQRKVMELKQDVEQTDIHTALIANGILDVIN
jgi:ATP-dependent helicase HepA